MSKFMSAVVGTLALVALAACEKQLVVSNLNAPDEVRALASASDVENLIGSQFRVIHNYTDGLSVSLEFQLECLGMENASGLGNAESGKYCGIPRVPVDNTRANPSDANKLNSWNYLSRAARSVALGLAAMNKTGFTFLPPDAAEVARDKAFGYFELGVALGNMALVYDSGAVISPSDDVNLPAPNFVKADSLMKRALVFLDTAQQYATVSWDGETLPNSWINGQPLGQASFVKLIRSWKARLRAGVARTPTERAAVNWAQVIADAKAGVSSNFNITMTTGSPSWNYRPAQIDLYAAWHQMWQFMVGMADTSGTYSLYLANRSLYSPFLILTPDRRFPTGNHRSKSRAADTFAVPTGPQNLSSGCTTSGCLQPAGTAPYPYFRNRLAGNDSPVSDWMFSMYDFYRFQSFFNATRNGPLPLFTRAELNGLIAEGDIRTGAWAEAAQYIDSSRVKAGLPSVAGITDLTTPVPGANACVPRVPDPAASYKSAKCGNIMEAMKWEKRLETAYTHWGAWWTDGRGWGDLPALSVLEYPVPYEELDTRVMPLYNNTRQAALGTYGIQ